MDGSRLAAVFHANIDVLEDTKNISCEPCRCDSGAVSIPVGIVSHPIGYANLH